MAAPTNNLPDTSKVDNEHNNSGKAVHPDKTEGQKSYKGFQQGLGSVPRTIIVDHKSEEDLESEFAIHDDDELDRHRSSDHSPVSTAVALENSQEGSSKNQRGHHHGHGKNSADAPQTPKKAVRAARHKIEKRSQGDAEQDYTCSKPCNAMRSQRDWGADEDSEKDEGNYLFPNREGLSKSLSLGRFEANAQLSTSTRVAAEANCIPATPKGSRHSRSQSFDGFEDFFAEESPSATSVRSVSVGRSARLGLGSSSRHKSTSRGSQRRPAPQTVDPFATWNPFAT